MKRCIGTLVALVSSVVLPGCVGRLMVPLDCKQVREISLGMTRNEVVSTIGPPWGELAVSDSALDKSLVTLGGIHGYKSRGLGVYYLMYHSSVGGALRQDSLWVLLYGDRVYSVRAHRKYAGTAPLEALVLERDPLLPASPITHREGQAFSGMFPCDASKQ